VGFKRVPNRCDGGEPVALSPDRPRVVAPELDGFQKPQSFVFFAPGSVDLERHLYEERFPAAFAYARANQLNAIVRRGRRDRLGVVAAGKAYADVRQALYDLGLGDVQLAELGVRLLT